MPLLFNMETGEITYEGRRVGQHRVEDGTARVTLDFTFECGVDEWIVPLSWFGHGLNRLQKHDIEPREVVLEVVTHEEDVAEHFTALRVLTEKTIKQDGCVWRFHKNDADPWPSVLHAHEYEQNLKLDAVTGRIYDATTRALWRRLKRKKLQEIQTQLRESEDFADAVTEHVDGADRDERA